MTIEAVKLRSKVCKKENCERRSESRGLCRRHWQQWYRKTFKDIRCNRPEYRAWRNMKVRCYDPNFIETEHYKGRGLTVCDRWLNSFDNFLEDVGERPSKKHSLDRINNNKGYYPKNVRWATPAQQANNKQRKNPHGFPGIKKYYTKTMPTRWIASISVNQGYIHLGIFNTKEEAIEARKEANLKYERY